MMQIKLSGKLGKGKYFIVDNEDAERVLKHTWWLDRLGRPQTDIKYKRVLIGRFIMVPQEDKVVDHINGNVLDNRKINLRACTRFENQRNRTKLNKNSTSGYRGITWDKERKKWVAQLSLNYKHIFLGRFEDLEDAREVVKEAITEKHKDFANFTAI